MIRTLLWSYSAQCVAKLFFISPLHCCEFKQMVNRDRVDYLSIVPLSRNVYHPQIIFFTINQGFWYWDILIIALLVAIGLMFPISKESTSANCINNSQAFITHETEIYYLWSNRSTWSSLFSRTKFGPSHSLLIILWKNFSRQICNLVNPHIHSTINLHSLTFNYRDKFSIFCSQND